MSSEGIAFFNTTVDKLVTAHDCLLWGFMVLASALGGDVTFYAGRDATSGRKIGTVKGGATLTNPIMLAKPIFCDGGLYIDVGSSITEATVFYEPLED